VLIFERGIRVLMTIRCKFPTNDYSLNREPSQKSTVSLECTVD